MNSIPVSSLASSPQLATSSRVAARGANAAREFEAQLIGSLVESFEKTFASLPGKSTIPGADDYGYIGAQALSQGLAARGGFGIAAMIEKHLSDKPAAKTRK